LTKDKEAIIELANKIIKNMEDFDLHLLSYQEKVKRILIEK
jgi:hypothetical protein